MPSSPITSSAPTLYRDALAVNLPSVGANASLNHDVALPAGAATMGNRYVLEARHDADLAHGLVITAAYIPAQDTLRLRLSNFTAAPIDPAAGTLHVAILSAQ